MHKKFGLPLVNGHIFTRDFSWVSRYDPRLTPDLFHQNPKNPLPPSWMAVSKSAIQELQRALHRVRGLSKTECLTVILRAMELVKTEYGHTQKTTPPMHTVSAVKRALNKLPANWVLGMFDKGTTALYACCKYMFMPMLHRGFLQAPKRFTEVCCCDSNTHAAYECCAYTVTGAKAFVNGRAFKNDPRYPLPDALVQRGVIDRLAQAREPPKTLPPMTSLAKNF